MPMPSPFMTAGRAGKQRPTWGDSLRELPERMEIVPRTSLQAFRVLSLSPSVRSRLDRPAL